jgi:nucleoporin NUP159
LSFKQLGKENKARILPQPWPQDAPPVPYASLLAVASQRGLIAAAGHNAVYITTTDAVRKAYDPESTAVKNVEIVLELRLPRLSQLSFSSDEKWMVACAESGGGLAVYDVDALNRGIKDAAFQLATEGISVQALAPNPAIDNAQYYCVLLSDGKMMLVDLNKKEFVSGANGPVFLDGVSSVAWSNRGKQIVAGFKDGTAQQVKPDGKIANAIPLPPDTNGVAGMLIIRRRRKRRREILC